MFKIIKKGSGNFWHNFNNGSKEVNLSDWEIVLDSVNQTVSLQMLNGANVPQTSVIISDIVVIDETDGSVEETFGSVSILRTRLIELNYTPYIVLNGFVPEAPIDGLTYGRKDAEWVEVSGGGGSTPDATTTVKGKLKLAGDLAGTADLPTVPELANKANIASPTFTGTVTTPAIVVSSETASRVAIIDASKNVKSADIATYPSLTELARLKGITSPVQTQLDNINPVGSKLFLYYNFY